MGALVTHRREIRFKRKDLVASAYKTVIARVEMLYRIRRRSSDPNHKESDAMRIRDKFHEIQEDTEYYATMLSLECEKLGKKYEDFVTATKEQTSEEMKSAWSSKGDVSGGNKYTFDRSCLHPTENEFLEEAKRFTTKWFTKK